MARQAARIVTAPAMLLQRIGSANTTTCLNGGCHNLITEFLLSIAGEEFSSPEVRRQRPPQGKG